MNKKPQIHTHIMQPGHFFKKAYSLDVTNTAFGQADPWRRRKTISIKHENQVKHENLDFKLGRDFQDT